MSQKYAIFEWHYRADTEADFGEGDHIILPVSHIDAIIGLLGEDGLLDPSLLPLTIGDIPLGDLNIKKGLYTYYGTEQADAAGHIEWDVVLTFNTAEELTPYTGRIVQKDTSEPGGWAVIHPETTWDAVSNTPTTLAGYGITDAYDKDYIDTLAETVGTIDYNLYLLGLDVEDNTDDLAILNGTVPTLELVQNTYYNAATGTNMYSMGTWTHPDGNYVTYEDGVVVIGNAAAGPLTNTKGQDLTTPIVLNYNNKYYFKITLSSDTPNCDAILVGLGTIPLGTADLSDLDAHEWRVLEGVYTYPYAGSDTYYFEVDYQSVHPGNEDSTIKIASGIKFINITNEDYVDFTEGQIVNLMQSIPITEIPSAQIVGLDKYTQAEVDAMLTNSTNWDTAYGWGDHGDGGYLTSFTETDPIFSAWDKSTGISIVMAQITDLAFPDETDPIFIAWDKSTGITITESQITDLQAYIVTETDPVFIAWDKSTGISITESQITDLDKYTQAEVLALTWTESDITDLDKYTQAEVLALTWTESDITDLDKYTQAAADAKFALIHTHPYVLLAGDTMSGMLNIVSTEELPLFLHKTTSTGSVGIKFSDRATPTQWGIFKFEYHDDASPGGLYNTTFTFTSHDPVSTQAVVLENGDFFVGTNKVWHAGSFDPSDYSATTHLHDDRYYTEIEADAKYALIHTHPYRADTWVPAWTDVTGKPSLYTQAEVLALTWTESDITDLDKYTQAAADAKFALIHTHPYLADTTTVGDLGGRTAAQITTEIGDEIAAILGDAPALLDTLGEIADFIEANEDAIGVLEGGVTNWDTAYGWGDHSGLYSLLSHDHDADYADISHNHAAIYEPLGTLHDDRYYTETEIDSLLTSSGNWDTAYGWGDHSGLYSLLSHDHDKYEFNKTGWDYQPDLEVSCVDATRTFTITFNSVEDYWINSVKVTKQIGSESVVFDDTEGLKFFYYTTAGLIASDSAWTFNLTKALVAYGLWDATNKEMILLGPEWHGWMMDDRDHEMEHLTYGTRYSSGFAVTTLTTTTIKVDPGVMYDEDLRLTLGENIGVTQTLDALVAPILYRNADGDIRKIAGTTATCYLNTQPQVNLNTAGVWSLEDVSNNKYFVYWLVITNDSNDSAVIWMPGQYEGDNLTDAKALNDLSTLETGALEMQEFIILGRLLMKAGNGSYTIEEFETYRSDKVSSAVVSIGDHIHDDRYYTEVELDAALLLKSDEHSHPYLPLIGGTLTGDIELGTNSLKFLAVNNTIDFLKINYEASGATFSWFHRYTGELTGNENGYEIHSSTNRALRITQDGIVSFDSTPKVGVVALVKTDDSRLSDNRDPNAHTHVEADITDLDKYTQAEVDTLLTGYEETHSHPYLPLVGGTLTGALTIDGGSTASTGILGIRQSGDTLADGIAITSSHGTSHRIWKDAAGALNFGPTGLPSAFKQDILGNLDIAGSINIPSGDHLQWQSGNARIGETGYDLYFSTWTGSALTEKMRILSNGNIGIGTASPTKNLEVYGANARIVVSHNAYDVGEVGYVFRHRLNPGSGVGDKTAIISKGVDSHGLSDLHFVVDSATDYDEFTLASDTKMIIKNDGKIGIGTIVPLALLHIKNETLDNSVFKSMLTIGSNENSESPQTSFDETKPSYGITFRRDWNSDGKQATLAGIYASGHGGYRGGLVFRTKDNTTSNGVPDVTALFIAPSGIADFAFTPTVNAVAVSLVGHTHVVADLTDWSDLWVDVTGDTMTGDLTIETKLFVGTGDMHTNRAAHINGTLRVGPYSATTDIDYIDLIPGGTDSVIQTSNDGTMAIKNLDTATGTLSLWTNALERLTVAHDGKVGIGTNAPNELLEIKNGSIKIWTDDTYDYALTLGRDGVYPAIYGDAVIRIMQRMEIWGSSNGYYFDVRNAAGAVDAKIDGAGDSYVNALANNFGIGTSSPSTKLHAISAQAGKPVLTLQNTNAAGYSAIHFKHTSNTHAGHIGYAGTGTALNDVMFIGSIGAYPLVFTTSDTEKMRIATSGNVGIGTDNPSRKLHIYEDSSGGSAHTYTDLLIESSEYAMITLLTPNTGKGYYGFADPEDSYVAGMYYAHATNELSFDVNNTLALRIDSDGIADFVNTPTIDGTAVSLVGHTHASDDTNTYVDSITLADRVVTLGRSGALADLTLDLSTQVVNKIRLTGRSKTYKIFSVNKTGSQHRILHGRILSSNNYAATDRSDVHLMLGFYNENWAANAYQLGQDNAYPVYFSLYDTGTNFEGFITMSNYTDNAVLTLDMLNLITITMIEEAPTGDLLYNSETSENFILDSSNYDSYALPLVGGTLTGALTIDDAILQINTGSEDDEVFFNLKYNDNDAYQLFLKQTVSSGVVRYNFSMINVDTVYDDVLVLDRGKVGIGTTDPEYTLHVDGQIKITNANGGAWNDGLIIEDATGWAATVYARGTAAKMFTGLRDETDDYIWMAPVYDNTGTNLTPPRDDTVLLVDEDAQDIKIFLPTQFGQGVRMYDSLRIGDIVIPNATAQWGVGGTTTGCIVIELPNTVAMYDMMTITIDTYEYTTNTHSTYTMSGHNWTTSTWYNYSVIGSGNNIDEVQLGVTPGGRHCIIIGTVSKSWSYGRVAVTKVISHPTYDSQNWEGSWNVSQVTDLTGYTALTGNIAKAIFHEGNFLAGTDYLTSVAWGDLTGTQPDPVAHTHNYLSQIAGGALDVDADNGTGLYPGSTGTWTNKGPAGNNAGALLSINTHPGNYFSQLWFDTAGGEFYARHANAVLPTTTWNKILTSANIGTYALEDDHDASAVTAALIVNWDLAYGWGDHGVEGYLTGVAWGDLTGTQPDPVAHTHAYLPLAGGTMTGDLTFDTDAEIVHNTDSNYMKYRVYSDDNYGIGMVSGLSFGAINNDWAMTFTFNDDADRGFLWRDTNHSTSQGAMALSTGGKLTVAHSLRVGYGTSDTAVPGATYDLDISGDALIGGNIVVSEDVTIAGMLNAHLYSYEGGVRKIVNPKGGLLNTAVSNIDGAIRIKLPQKGESNTMLRMVVDVYNYAHDTSFTVTLGGYLHAAPSWTNTFAIFESTDAMNITRQVHFALDASNYGVIYIGDVDATEEWDYSIVSVRELLLGHSGDDNVAWMDALSISYVTSIGTDTIEISETGTQLDAGTLEGHAANYFQPLLDKAAVQNLLDLTTTNNSGSMPVNDVVRNTIGYASSFPSGDFDNFSNTDGGLYAGVYSSSWVHEIYGDFRTGHMAVRGKNNGTWMDWLEVLDMGNFDDYALPLTGGAVTGETTFADKIGIGTTSPQNSLELVNASGETGLRLRSNYASVGSNATIGFRLSTTVVGENYAEITAYRTNDPASTATDLLFKTRDGTSIEERMRLTSTGILYVGGSIIADDSLYINYDQSDDNAVVFFGDVASAVAHFLKFDATEQVFYFSDELEIGGYTAWHANNFDPDDYLTDTGLTVFTVPAGQLGSQASEINTLQIKQATASTDAMITFHVGGDYALHFGLDGTTNDLFVGGWSMGVNKYKIFHEGNFVAGTDYQAPLVADTDYQTPQTTLAGYGITDAFDGAFSSLTGTPTTLAGYGITDGEYSLTEAKIETALTNVTFGDGYMQANTYLQTMQFRTSTKGTLTAPAYRFSGDADTGMFFPSLDQLAFSAGGVEMIRLIEGTTPSQRITVSANIDASNTALMLGLSTTEYFGYLFSYRVYRNAEYSLSDITRKKDINRIQLDNNLEINPSIAGYVEGKDGTMFRQIELLFEQLNIYTFNYNDDEADDLKIGVMAQEIEIILKDHPVLLAMLVSRELVTDRDGTNEREDITIRTDNIATLKTVMIKHLQSKVKKLEDKHNRMVELLISKGLITQEEGEDL